MNRPLQVAFLAALAVPPIVAAKADPEGLSETIDWIRDSFRAEYGMLFLLCSLCLSVERFCYTFVWCYPKKFLKFCELVRGTPLDGPTPVDVIVNLFYINKFFQYGGFALFFFATDSRFQTPSLFRIIVGTQLVALGQILNVGIYRAIGKKGVYYGCKFDQHAAWCTGFPFNVVTAHPQYLGSVLTTFGATLFLAYQHLVSKGWFGLAAMQAAQYAYMSYVEHNL